MTLHLFVKYPFNLCLVSVVCLFCSPHQHYLSVLNPGRLPTHTPSTPQTPGARFIPVCAHHLPEDAIAADPRIERRGTNGRGNVWEREECVESMRDLYRITRKPAQSDLHTHMLLQS